MMLIGHRQDKKIHKEKGTLSDRNDYWKEKQNKTKTCRFAVRQFETKFYELAVYILMLQQVRLVTVRRLTSSRESSS